MAKLSKSLFAGDPAPEFDTADADAQHVFVDDAVADDAPRTASAFDRLVAISERTTGDVLTVAKPTSAHEIEDDLDLSPRTGE